MMLIFAVAALWPVGTDVLLPTAQVPAGTSGEQAPGGRWMEVAVSLDATDQSLAAIAALLAPQLPHGIVVDGQPRTAHASLKVSGTTREVLDRAADAFDYMWSVSDQGVVLMQKRFRDQKELPQLLRGEMERVANQYTRILRAVGRNPSEPTYRTIRSLAATFNETQWQTLRAGGEMAVSELSRPQQQLVLDAIYQFVTQETFLYWDLLRREVESLQRASLYSGPVEFYNPYTKSRESQPILMMDLTDKAGRRLNGTLYDPPPFGMTTHHDD